jgi:hypothetical protein
MSASGVPMTVRAGNERLPFAVRVRKPPPNVLTSVGCVR